MLTTQEALEAMVGRSPDGKPLVFVSQQDFDALRKKHEALLEAVREPESYRRLWAALVLSIVAIGIAIVVAVAKELGPR